MKFLIAVPVVLAALALLALGAAAHPFAPLWPAALIVAWCAFMLVKPRWWMAAYLALIPGLDLAPFSGWFFLEDFDIVTLCVLVVGYCQWLARKRHGAAAVKEGLFMFGALLLSLYVLALLISAFIGLLPFAPLDANAFSHYFSRYNALRLLKAPLFALLLIPLVFHEFQFHRAQAVRAVVVGMCSGLGVAVATVVWERATFMDLTNLSADYRVTGFFSATHTGGAALDGYLALSLPFAVLLLLGRTGMTRLVLGGGLTLLGLYAVLMTFSRALYAAVAASLAAQVVFSALMKPGAKHGTRLGGLIVLPFVALAAYWALLHVFGTSGYRGLGAALGVFAGLYLLTATPLKVSWQGIFTALGILLVSVVLVSLIKKGAYIAYALSAIALVASLMASATARMRYAWACMAGLVLNMVVVASYWGGDAARFDALIAIAVALSLAGVNAVTRQRLWSLSGDSLALVWMGLVGIAVTVVAMNSYYAGSRFSSADKDWAGRMQHWTDVYHAMEQSTFHRMLGTGLGRMPETYFWRNRGADIPGTFMFEQELGNQFLRLSGPRYTGGYGDPLRMLQAIQVSSPRVTLEVDVRTSGPVQFIVAICARHLIYTSRCSAKHLSLKGSPAWVKKTVELDLSRLLAERGWLPKPLFVVLANDTQKSFVDIDNVQLQGVYGSESMRNGTFTHGLDHWYFSSDRFHLAWHAKNMFLHVLFEQGAIGLALFTALLLTAFIRLIRPATAGHRGAIALVAALASFVVVGLFDSLLDVPRLSLLFYLFVFAATLLPHPLLFAQPGTNGARNGRNG